MLLLALLATACSLTRIPGADQGCKIRTYIEAPLSDYLTTRFHSDQVPRIGVIPFDVPETFAPPGVHSQNFGRELANMFQHELLRQGELGVIELFDRDRWPGKRAEFFSGNYGAIQLARDAGYDLVVVGFMEDIVNESDISVYTRVIDTSNSVTVWYAKTTAYSSDRAARRRWSSLSRGLIDDKPALFDFPGRSERLVSCTVERLLQGTPRKEKFFFEQNEEQRPVRKAPPL